MEQDNLELLNQIVDVVADSMGGIDDSKKQKTLAKLKSMQPSDAVDNLLISLNKTIENGKLQKNDVLNIANNYLTKILPQQYPDTEALVNRLGWLKSMNMDNMAMPLSQNHTMVTETFDQINILLCKNFDYYHTGGLMAYLATDRPLERYHGDLDIFFNEKELTKLKAAIDQNPDFNFITNLDNKENNGHEFSIQYKNSPINVGLFLFDRTNNDEITLKSYYYADKNPNNELLVDEKILTQTNTALSFPQDNYQEHNGIPYRVQSLEAIYSSKLGARPKDIYDTSVIQNDVNMDKVAQINHENTQTKNIEKTVVSNSIVKDLNQSINPESQQLTSNNSEKTLSRV